jgi:hypothetical protein
MIALIWLFVVGAGAVWVIINSIRGKTPSLGLAFTFALGLVALWIMMQVAK